MHTNKEKIQVVWLKRDLRLQDNEAIYNALASNKPTLFLYVFEKSLIGGQINVTFEVENYPGIPEVLSGFELSDRIKQQADKFGPEFVDEEIIKIDFEIFDNFISLFQQLVNKTLYEYQIYLNYLASF